MKFIYLILILFLVSCNENIKTQPKISFEDSITATLIGKWGGQGEKDPVWEIRKDSVYYFEHLRAYPYELKNHDLIINLSNNNQVKLENTHVIVDTLFFISHLGLTTRAVRFK